MNARKDKFQFEKRGVINVKGKGDLTVNLLESSGKAQRRKTKDCINADREASPQRSAGHCNSHGMDIDSSQRRNEF